MFPNKEIVDYGPKTLSDAKDKSQSLLAKLIKERNWKGASQRVRSHPHEILIQDCHGLNSLHKAVQSFYGTIDTISLSLHNSMGRSHEGSICSRATLMTLLSSPFSQQGLIYQPPPLRMIISSMDELPPSFEVGATPLHLACRNANIPDNIIKAIARANPLALNLQDDDGDTPLHLALRHGFSEDVQQTLIELACKITAPRLSEDDTTDFEDVTFAKSDYEDGDLPLHVAISHDASIGSIQLLVDAYPKGMFAKNHVQQTPLLVAYLCGRYDLVEKVILKSDVVLEYVRDLLEIGGDESDGGVHRPLYYLWEQVLSATEEVGSADVVEAFEGISTLLTAATSNIASVHNTAGYEATQNEKHDKHDKQVCYITTHAKIIPKLSFSEAYRLLLASINVGEGIIPPEYVSFLIQTHPGIVRKTEPSSGRTPLHIAVMQPHHRNLLRDSAIDCFAHSASKAASRDEDPSSSCSSKHFKIISFFSFSKDDSLRKKSHSILKVILDANPMAAYQRDNCGCLPFHLAIKAGMAWEDCMKDVFMVGPEALRVLDPETGLYPFMLAASMKSGIRMDVTKDKADNNLKSNGSLDEVFSLLRCAPDLVASPCYSENYPMNEKTWKRSLLRKEIIGKNSGNTTSLIAGKHMLNLDSSATADLLHLKKRHKFQYP